MQQLSITDAAILSAFDRWIKDNPGGGIFSYHGFTVRVTQKAIIR